MANLGNTYRDAWGDEPANSYSDKYSGGGAVTGGKTPAPYVDFEGIRDAQYDTYGPAPSQRVQQGASYGAGVSGDYLMGTPVQPGVTQPQVTQPTVTQPQLSQSSYANSFLNSNPGAVSSGIGLTPPSKGSSSGGSGIRTTGAPLATPQATVSTKVSNQPLPTFKMPTYDEGAIKKARQKKMGPMTRELRMAVQTALSKSYENPAVRNQAVEAALRGYGVGLEKAAMGAEAAAQQEYNQQYAREMQGAQVAFTNAMNAWQGSQINVSTTTPFDVNKQSDLDKIKTMFA